MSQRESKWTFTKNKMKNESVWIFVINDKKDKTEIIIYILSHIALYKHLYFKKEFRIPKSSNTKLSLLPFPNTFEEYNTTIKIQKIKSSDSPSHWFRFRPLENDSKARILASNYTVKVTKRTWDVCRRCTFAEEGGGPKGKKTEREGRKREVHPAMRHNSWSDCELSQRPRELEVEEDLHRLR